MLRRCLTTFALVALTWAGSTTVAAAQHERHYEFDGNHIALSIERFMGVDFVDFEGPGRSDVSARLLLNASEPVPTSYARFGFDFFINRLSIGVAGGVTSEDVGLIAPRVGYLFGLTPQIGLWLRGGVFYASPRDYLGVTAEALFGFFPDPNIAFTFGPTLDIAFTDDPGFDYIAVGIPEVGMSFFF